MEFDYDMGYMFGELEGMEKRENLWKNGVHVDRELKEHLIKDMTNSHLLNTIKFFSALDTTPLIEEAKKRNI